MEISNSKYKILLINPPHIQRKGLYPRVVFEPLGLAYIGAYLEKAGYDVTILDAIGLGFNILSDIDKERQLVGLTYEEIGNYVKTLSPQVIGIGIPFTIRAESAFAIASLVKRINKNVITIVGGIHATTYQTECLNHPSVDYIVIGEGEVSMLNLIRTLQNGKLQDVEILRGIGYKKDGLPIINSPQDKVINLDEVPFPARHLLPMEKYFEAAKNFKSGRHGRKFSSVITSRGCPYKCTFCVSHNVMGRKWRYRSPENVVDEIEYLLDRYGVNFIHFEDDNLTLKKDRIVQICKLIIKRGLKIRWDTPNGIMAHTIADENVLRIMKASGCKEICVAPESGNQYVVDNLMKKRINLKKIEEVVRICKKIGIRVEAFFVIGIIGETKSNIKDTINFARNLRKLGAARCHFHIATPFEGTELYLQANTLGYLVKPGKDCIQLETSRIETPEFTCQDIDSLLQEGMKINPIIPTDKIYLAIKLLTSNPILFLKSTFNYLVKRQGGLSS